MAARTGYGVTMRDHHVPDGSELVIRKVTILCAALLKLVHISVLDMCVNLRSDAPFDYI